MTARRKRFDAAPVLEDLMDFQARTVDYAFERLFTALDSTQRFLVADEVGLGKTMVARGVSARAIEHLQTKRVQRIDIVYVCSNGAIAQQNLARLQMEGVEPPVSLNRLTLLPLHIGELEQRRISLVAFTPGTSLALKGSLGAREERAVLLALLEHPRAWGPDVVGTRGRNILTGYAGVDGFDCLVKNTRARLGDLTSNDPAKRFWSRIRKRKQLRKEWEVLREYYKRSDSRIPPDISRRRTRLVGELRHILAAASLDALQPDLIILDEFQRFSHLLSGEGGAAELANELFDWAHSRRDEQARVLMLSATPYKMYTLDSERENDDHYSDLLRTLEFLCHDDQERFKRLTKTLSRFSGAVDAVVQGLESDLGELRRLGNALQSELGQLMSRVERITATVDHGGLLNQLRVPPGGELTARDVSGYVTMRRLARKLGQGNPLEYWKSVPYALTYLSNYAYRNAVDRALEDGSLMPLELEDSPSAQSSCLLLPEDAVEKFGTVDMSNPRLRSLANEMVDESAAAALWMPPVLPYYALAGPTARLAERDFTKRLVFSAWTAVPRAAASVLSYEAERRAFSAAYRGRSFTYSNLTQGTPIRFQKSRGAIRGLSTWAWLYPSTTLIQLADPLLLAQRADDQPTAAEMLSLAEEAIRPRLDDLLEARGATTSPRKQADTAWYWAAPLLLDQDARPADVLSFLDSDRLSTAYWEHQRVDRRTMQDGALHEAVDRALDVVNGREELGPVPDDLCRVLAYVGLAGAANCAARSLSRECGEVDGADLETRFLATAVGAAMRDLFNRPHNMAAVRSVKEPLTLPKHAYWLRAIAYAFAAGVQPMLDEYIHVLGDARQSPQQLTRDVLTALTVGATSVFAASPGRERKALRTHHAAAFGLGSAADDAQTERTANLRDAFNSPFRPFVLISTSVGQEGLDFHKYCHAIVHWNLPSSAVDFEQREGRVHRYKGHAVRKNVVKDHGAQALEDPRPWPKAFELASAQRTNGASQMIPYWVYPQDTTGGGYSLIIREVPLLPLSSDAERRRKLQRTLGAYRMVFGQPRQEDLVVYMLGQVDEERLAAIRDAASINLEPSRGAREDEVITDGGQQEPASGQ